MTEMALTYEENRAKSLETSTWKVQTPTQHRTHTIYITYIGKVLSFIQFLFSGHLCQVLTSSDNFFFFKINMSEESLKMEDGEELNLDTTSIENLTDNGECPSLSWWAT